MHIEFGYGCYDGDVNSDQMPHGKGTITYYKENTKIPDGKVSSEFVHGVMVGDATVDYCNGSIYVGKYDKSEGHRIEYGVMKYADGGKYEGNWEKDLRHGKGNIIFSNGDKYIGNWKNNNMHGYGSYYYTDGNYYKGNFVKDLFQGNGTFYYANGNKYVGKFKDDMFNGEGTLFDKDGNIIHKGNWKDGNFIE